jgi:NADPH:quinone reductase-like Zn-dependent oxidoreductase
MNLATQACCTFSQMSFQQEFVDLGSDTLEDVGKVDLVLDVIGGDIGKRSARLIRPGGTLVSIVSEL